MKRYLLSVFVVVATLMTIISCNKPSPVEPFTIVRSWQLKSIYGVVADVNIFVDFSADGTFTICQLTEDYSYVVYNGTYTVDKENSLLSGVYSDGVAWSSDYAYTLDEKARELVLERVGNRDEISVYVPAPMPDLSVRSMSKASISWSKERPL